MGHLTRLSVLVFLAMLAGCAAPRPDTPNTTARDDVIPPTLRRADSFGIGHERVTHVGAVMLETPGHDEGHGGGHEFHKNHAALFVGGMGSVTGNLP